MSIGSMDISQNRKFYPIPPPLPFHTPGEDLVNALLHGLGSLLAGAGLVLLVLRARDFPESGNRALVCYIIFTAAMIFVFLVSTLYHAVRHEGAKRVFRVLDHGAIYLLIAGTYTPFCLLVLKGLPGRIFLGIEWGLALTGIFLHLIHFKFIGKIEPGIYVLMGWAIAVLWFRLLEVLPLYSFIMLVAGGIAYTLGIHWYR
ncbi:MAG: hemolysin III family protein, partial [Treponema sp.]|nr:hemolysin III family protein [Treponema sp.]